MVEILVTIVVFSIGLLGIAGLQTLSIKRSQSALFHSIAASQASDIAERMRANYSQLDAYVLALGAFVSPASKDCSSAVCSLSDFVGYDAYAWSNGNVTLLPDGKGVVCKDDTPDDGTLTDPACDGGTRVAIKIFWNDARSDGRASKSASSSDTSQRYSMNFSL